MCVLKGGCLLCEKSSVLLSVYCLAVVSVPLLCVAYKSTDPIRDFESKTTREIIERSQVHLILKNRIMGKVAISCIQMGAQ